MLKSLHAETPESQRTDADDPRSLARTATGVEMRNPGTLERSFGGRGAAGVGSGMGAGMGAGMGMVGLIGGTLLASVAGAFIGSAIANEMFADEMGAAEGFGDGTGGEGMDAAADGDFGGGNFGGGDFGGYFAGF